MDHQPVRRPLLVNGPPVHPEKHVAGTDGRGSLVLLQKVLSAPRHFQAFLTPSQCKHGTGPAERLDFLVSGALAHRSGRFLLIRDNRR